MKENRKKHKSGMFQLCNDGYTLVIVLIGVSFLIILATIIMATSMGNLRMKQIEYVSKKNFYSDEQILDDIYNGIGKVTTDCLSKSYTEILSQVSVTNGTAVFDSQDAAYEAFSNRFITHLTDKFPECADDSASGYSDIFATLSSYITQPSASAELVRFNSTEIVKEDSIPFQYIFRDVTVRFKMLANGAESGYESTITTDIVIEIPYINFFQNSSNILDYALIGNKGIYFNGDDKSRTVTGNIYAGISDTESIINKATYRDEDVYGGLNFYNVKVTMDSNYIVSKGDINVRKSDVTIGNSEPGGAYNQIWAESIRTAENENRNAGEELSKLSITGDMYVANDLELNARRSIVKLVGNYYGYNNGSYETQEKSNLTSSYVTTGHTQSSAMIINGNRSALDLSDLNTMVVAGVAYVDLQSKAYSGTPPAGNHGGNTDGRIEEYATGESLALKSNQYMYLAPTSCLLTSNPVKKSEAPVIVWDDAAADKWFGNKGYVDSSNPIIKKDVTNRTTGIVYTYYYLNFINENRKTEYANLVLNMIDPVNGLDDMDTEIKKRVGYIDHAGNPEFDELELAQIWQIKKSLQEKALHAGTKSTIQIADDTKASIYTRGAITRVTGSELDSQLPISSSALPLDYISKVESNLVKHYKYLYAELDPREEFSLTSDNLPDLPLASIDSEAPLSHIADLTGIVNADTTYRCDSSYKTIICGGNYTLNNNIKGIIIAKGDVTISNNASISGLVIAGGKIYIEGGGKIEANRSIVQEILDEEVTEESKKTSITEKDMGYASSYLLDYLNTIEYKGKDNTHRVSSTYYQDYISYGNWRKGEV